MRFSKKLGWFGLCWFLGAGSASVSAVENSVMRLALVRGEVSVDGVRAKDGQTLISGQVIETHSGKCTILVGGGHVIHLDSDSRFKIEKYEVDAAREKAEFDLKYGKTRALIQSQSAAEAGRKRSFSIRARTTVMGVRGTHVYVDNPKDPRSPQNFMTIEGIAELSDGQSGAPGRVMPLKKAESVTIRSDENVRSSELKVVQVSPQKMRELTNEIQPPPVDVQSREDLRRVRERHPQGMPGMPNGMGFGPGAGPVFGQNPLPLDPVADNRVPVHVNVSVKKH